MVKKQMVSWLRKVWVVILSLLAVAATGWVGDGLGGACMFEPWFGECVDSTQTVLRAGIGAAVFLVCAILLYYSAKDLVLLRHLTHSPTVKAHRVLIATLSDYSPRPVQEGTGWVISDGKGKEVRLTGSLTADIEALDRAGTPERWFWNGEQFLRALVPHVGKEKPGLEHLVLVGSSGKRSSYGLLGPTREIALLYRPGLQVYCHDTAIDFEDISTLQEVFDHWIDHFLSEGIPEKEIILDTTGGNKTASIAAALTTLRRHHVHFQYVQTSGENRHAISFNVIVETMKQDT